MVVPGSPLATAPSPSPSSRAGVSLIRCADVCTRPEKLAGARVCYHTMTDRIAKLLWDKPPKNVLLVKKWRDSSAASFAFGIATWLLKEHDARVWMTADETDVLPSGVELFAAQYADDVDVIVTIGGDGTVLYTSSLFQGPCPPLLSVAFGSLGFLTAVEPAHARAAISALLLGHEEPVEFAPRSRIRVTIQRAGSDVPETVMFGLNELVVDRGSSPYMTALDAFLDDEYLTVVQADGVLVATPTGSTAYSLSAGGSILFPTVPALLLTPICPHSLSFRPIMFPDSSTLKLVVPTSARGGWKIGVMKLLGLNPVTTACAKRTGAAASMACVRQR